MSELDPAWYPVTAAYLASLPGGLNAYPSCRVRAVWSRLSREENAVLWQDEHLPPHVRDLITAPWEDTDFIPAAVSVSVDLIALDRLYKHERVFLNSANARAKRLLSRPLFRVLTQIMSPATLLRSCAKHWEMFHQGTSLEFGGSDPTHFSMVMNHPAKLYPPIVILDYSCVFNAVLTAAGAKGLQIKCEQINDRSSRFNVSWQAKP